MRYSSLSVVVLVTVIWLLAAPARGAFGQPAPNVEALIDAGIKQRRSGLYEESIQTLERALALAQGRADVDGEWQARTFLALTHEVKGDLKRALKLHEENRAFARQHRDRLMTGPMNREADSLRAISGIHTLLGDPGRAAEVLKQDPEYAKGDREGGLGRAKLLQRSGINLFLAGRVDEAGEVLTAALAEYEARFQRVQKVVPGFADHEAQVEVVRWLQAVRVAQGRTAEALELAERGRARDFSALLARRRAVVPTPPRDASSASVSRIKEIARAQRTTVVVYSVVYTYDPSLPLEFSQFEQLPARDLFIWVIQPTGDIAFRHVSFARRPESLVDLVRTARESIGAPDPAGPRAGASGAGGDPRRNYPHLRRLHDVLIGPIARILPTDPAKRVTFIPQDVLFLVPFAALQDGNGIHLVERHAIVTAPSVQILDLVSRPDTDAGGSPSGALIVGNPKMPRVRRGFEGPRETLDRLPGSEQEAIAIARLLGSQAVIGEQATKAMIVPRMAGAHLVHFATHGLVDEVAPDWSALALAPDKNDPGLLTAREIRALRLRGDLVVLSACETARGKITGDGIGGLSRSFFAAGARSLVVSLWQVADTATGVLMTSFYEHLKQGQDKAQALRQAMLATRKQYPDPRRWAAFALVGSADTSDGLRALMKETARAAAREVAGRPDGVDRDPYRYFVFPLPDGAHDYREHPALHGYGVQASFHTGLGAGELMSFYRSELTRRGLQEDTDLTREDTRGFQLVFTGLPAGTLVIQGTGRSGGDDGSVSLRVEPLRR